MSHFDCFVVVDWSARSAPSPLNPSPDSIWIGVSRGGPAECHYLRTRAEAEAFLSELFAAEIAAGRRVLAGFDFPFAYPAGFARHLTGSDDPLVLWEWLAERIVDAADNANNRFDVARSMNRLFPGIGPFWGCPAHVADTDLPARGTLRHGHGMAERRQVEALIPRTQPCWKLYTTGSVGSQALLGLPRLQAMRQRFGAALSVAPFEEPGTPVVLVELFPSLLADEVVAAQGADEILDRAQVRVLAETISRIPPSDMDRLLRQGDPQEGWIFGAGDDALLCAAVPPVAPEPPPLRNDCFALPAGVDWIPVDDALDHLRRAIPLRAGEERVALDRAAGRILARELHALRSNPPHANTAVDGYGFTGARGPGTHVLPLVEARAAAGDMASAVPEGHAIRVLTGAVLPPGVDTVILQEDVTEAEGQIAFRGPLKRGANTRRAGEDVTEGAVILPAGRRLAPADLALATITGHGDLTVRTRLKVGVISTGDELRAAGEPVGPGLIHDANRPMLLSLLAAWGFEPVDLGHVPDDREMLRARLNHGTKTAQAILTSGGASAGDEDHVSALLREAGAMEMWRIAVKPGRPLALGLWNGCPVFGLPGNPVAALVCSLIFARPALGQMAGQGWCEPQAMELRAGFTKSKKPGRREYLRARLRGGRVEVFASEGSGRISGLSWADGLVELPDGAVEITPGTLVRYLPFSQFGF